jgi:hypothetical protein
MLRSIETQPLTGRFDVLIALRGRVRGTLCCCCFSAFDRVDVSSRQMCFPLDAAHYLEIKHSQIVRLILSVAVLAKRLTILSARAPNHP